MQNNNSTNETINYSERFAVWITQKVRTMPFFYAIFLWTFSWLLWNNLAPKHLQFDPAPIFCYGFLFPI